MTKNETIEMMKKVKEAHELQMQKIENAMNGEEIKNPPAVDKEACTFGKWLYNEENHIKEIIGSQFYAVLDLEHGKWHAEYSKIDAILFKGSGQKGLFSRFLGKKSIDPMQLDKIKLYYKELEEITQRLLKALASAQRRVSALNESKFY